MGSVSGAPATPQGELEVVASLMAEFNNKPDADLSKDMETVRNRHYGSCKIAGRTTRSTAAVAAGSRPAGSWQLW